MKATTKKKNEKICEIEKDSGRVMNRSVWVLCICVSMLLVLSLSVSFVIIFTMRHMPHVPMYAWLKGKKRRKMNGIGDRRDRAGVRPFYGQNNKMKFNKIINWKIRPFFLLSFFGLCFCSCCSCCGSSEAIVSRWFSPLRSQSK